MSIKTLRKRIALVAVSALGVGLLSVAPASADVDSNSVTLGTSTGVCASDNATGTLTTIAIAKSGNLVLSLNADSDADDTLKVTGVAYIDTITVLPGTALSTDQKKVTADTNDEGYTATVKFTGSGAATAYTQVNGAGANTQTISITVVDTCASVNTVNAANSFVQTVDTAARIQIASNSGTDTLTTITQSGSTRTYAQSGVFMNTSVDQKSTFTNGATAHVNLMGRDPYKNVLIGTDYVYQLSCTGDVSVNGGSSASGFIAGVASQYIAQFTVAQGTANSPVTTTCTASINGTAIGTKSIVFLGDLAKIEAALYAVGASNTAANAATAGSISYKYFDSAGNRLGYAQTGLSALGLTATGSALINALDQEAGKQTSSTATGYVEHNCVGAGKSGTVNLTLEVTNAAGSLIKSNSVAASCGGDIYTYTASLDKAAYQTGEVATLTVKALDVNGAVVNDYVVIGDASTSPIAISVGGMTAVVAPSNGDTFSSGVKTYTYRVDTTAGNYVASVSIPKAGSLQKPVTSQFSINPPAGTVTNAEVLASIVKLIAAINKQIRALQKQLRR